MNGLMEQMNTWFGGRDGARAKAIRAMFWRPGIRKVPAIAISMP